MSDNETAEREPEELIGQVYTDELCDGYDWNCRWPVLDAETLMILSIAYGDDNLDGYELANVADGQIVHRGDDHAADVLVAVQAEDNS